MAQGFLQTPIGILRICADEIGINEVQFCEETGQEEENKWIVQAKSELMEYFQGERKQFEVPLHLVQGTEFQRKCWEALCQIPYGETWSYYEEACYIQKPKALRAVGGANHRNPIVIMIPCHRVIAKNGGLCGYGGGIMRKEYLLQLEEEDDV